MAAVTDTAAATSTSPEHPLTALALGPVTDDADIRATLDHAIDAVFA